MRWVFFNLKTRGYKVYKVIKLKVASSPWFVENGMVYLDDDFITFNFINFQLILSTAPTLARQISFSAWGCFAPRQ